MTNSVLNKMRSVFGRLSPVSFLRPHVPSDFVQKPDFVQVRSDLIERGEDSNTIDALLRPIAQSNPDAGRYEILQMLLNAHSHPHQVNYLLGQEEFHRGIAESKAYPSYVLMDISNICTVECRFCKYSHNFLDKKWLTLEQIKQIEWLRYPIYLNFTAGTAEALSNPQFIPIFDYVKTTYPHLILGLLTNGRTLNERVLTAIAGRLNELHVSMNASNEADYNRIIANGSWSLFSKHMKLVKQMLKSNSKPWLQASFVKMRWNLDRAVEELEFAADHGADKVLFHHYYPNYIHDLHQNNQDIASDKFGPNESLYLEKDRSDEVFAKVRDRAKELNVEVETPPPFNHAGTKILWGARTLQDPPKDCSYPWTHLFLLWGWKSRREEVVMCCGLASDLGVYFEWDDVFTKDGLFKTWNAPTMQAYRRTVNGNRINPICALCRKIDQYSPDAVYPDQRMFFTFNKLPVPEHFQEGKWFELPMASGGNGCG